MEGGLDNAFDRAAGAVFRGPIEPAQIAKRAEKQMNHQKLVGSGKQYAPTLFTVLVNRNDDDKLFNFYPTMAAEIETYLVAKGTQNGLTFDGRPLVRFIVDKDLKSGKFDVFADNVAAPIIAQLREEEMEYYGLEKSRQRAGAGSGPGAGSGRHPADRSRYDHYDEMEPGYDAYDASDGQPYLRSPGQGRSPIPSMTPVVGQARLSDLNAGKSYALTRSPMVTGRSKNCDIPIPDANISREHAEFSQDLAGNWKIADLGSTNGTILNGNRIDSAALRDGDQITLGITVLEFRER